MENTATKLDQFPGLVAWFKRHRFELADRSPAERFVWKTCLALTSPGPLLIRQWSAAFIELMDDGDDPQDDFIEAKMIVDDCGLGLMELLADLGQVACQTNQAQSFQNAMTIGADNTSIAAFRFMSAWTALNSGDLPGCIEACEKIDEPFASVYAIQGQALLELGYVRQAIDSLSTAVKLEPKELVAWFQLAKAYHVLDQFRSAWAAIAQCQRLSPDNPEVALFAAMIALADEQDDHLQEAYEQLRIHFVNFREIADVALALLSMTLKLKDREAFQEVIVIGGWRSMREDPIFIQKIPAILRQLEALDWIDVARDLLIAITSGVDTKGA